MPKERTLRTQLYDGYMGRYTENVPLGVYSRYLPRGQAERTARNNGLGIIDYYPPVSLIAPPWHILPGFISKVKNAEFTIKYAWDSGKLIQERSFQTPVGNLYQLTEDDSSGAGSEHIVKHYVTKKEDYSILQYIIENTVFSSNLDEYQRRDTHISGDGIVLSRIDRSGFQKLLLELVGPERFLLDLFDFPGTVEELIGCIDEKGDEQLKMVLSQGHTLIWQPDNITSDMTPPTYFEQYHLPLYQKRQKLIEEMTGGKFIIHIDGKSKALAPFLRKGNDFILESFSLPCIGGDVELEDAPALFSGQRVFPNLPSNWSALSDDRFEEECLALKEQLCNLDYPTILQISEDLPEYAYIRLLPILTNVFYREHTV